MTKRVPLLIAALLSVSIALVSYRFLLLGVNSQTFPSMGIHINTTRLAFLAHIVASPIALAVGAFQFMPGLRAKHPALHRTLGRIYGLAILIGGAAALIMAPNSNGGIVSVIGFGMLSVLWVGATFQAIRHAIARRLALHRIWMIRSFALTFAAVTLRLELQPLMQWGGLEYNEAIQVTAWLCWVPNLIFVEWWTKASSMPARALAET